MLIHSKTPKQTNITATKSGRRPCGRARYPIQQLRSGSADTKVKMYTGKRENSPSNKQWSKRLHPEKHWCRSTGSSENTSPLCKHLLTLPMHRLCCFFQLAWRPVNKGNDIGLGISSVVLKNTHIYRWYITKCTITAVSVEDRKTFFVKKKKKVH